jgi:predicted hydrolase (HD superfamily)
LNQDSKHRVRGVHVEVEVLGLPAVGRMREVQAEVGGTMTDASEFGAVRARALMEEWTAGESLRKHCLGVSICCAWYGRAEAARMGLADEQAQALADEYAAAGLLHDFDYEKHPTPEEHPFVGVAYLRGQGWPEEILHAILAHADYSGVVPETHLDRTLFACDELAGFLTACALVKPTKSILEVETKGVLKKMKDKAFARAVKREDMTAGAELLGISIEEHVGNCLGAMQAKAAELGLAGSQG